MKNEERLYNRVKFWGIDRRSVTPEDMNWLADYVKRHAGSKPLDYTCDDALIAFALEVGINKDRSDSFNILTQMIRRLAARVISRYSPPDGTEILEMVCDKTLDSILHRYADGKFTTSGLVRTICHRRYADEVRRLTRYQITSLEEVTDELSWISNGSLSPEEQVERKLLLREAERQVRKFASGVEPNQVDAFVLWNLCGYDKDEIGEELGVSILEVDRLIANAYRNFNRWGLPRILRELYNGDDNSTDEDVTGKRGENKDPNIQSGEDDYLDEDSPSKDVR